MHLLLRSSCIINTYTFNMTQEYVISSIYYSDPLQLKGSSKIRKPKIIWEEGYFFIVDNVSPEFFIYKKFDVVL